MGAAIRRPRGPAVIDDFCLGASRGGSAVAVLVTARALVTRHDKSGGMQ